MLKIGLTGGIGSGKTTVAKYFAKLKVPIIDTDEIAHELLRPQTFTYKKIVTHFGRDFLTPQKLINRKKLRKLIFANPKERAWLEKIMHVQIRTLAQKRVAKIRAPLCIIVIPLLLETKYPIKVDRILVVDCPKKLQLKRLCKRDHCGNKQAQLIIKTQVSRSLRLKKAHDVIKNSGSLKSLKKIVKNLYLYYLSIT